MDPVLVGVATVACIIVAVLICVVGIVLFSVGLVLGRDSGLRNWGYGLVVLAIPVSFGGWWLPMVTAALLAVVLLALLVFAVWWAISAWVGRN